MREVKVVYALFRNTPYEDLLDALQIDCDVKGLTSQTVRVYFEQVGHFLRFAWCDLSLEPEDITRETIKKYILRERAKISPQTGKPLSANTINSRLRGIRVFFNCLEREELLSGNNPMKGISEGKAPRRVKELISPEQMSQILRGLNRQKGFYALRAQLVLLIFWDTMIRRNELITLRLDRVNIKKRHMVVFGKGQKERTVPMGARTARAVSRFNTKYRRKLPGTTLVCRRDGSPMTSSSCSQLLKRLRKRYGIRISPHLIRHSAATHYASQPGANMAILQAILGHTSLSMTQKYLHISPDAVVNNYVDFSPSNFLKY